MRKDWNEDDRPIQIPDITIIDLDADPETQPGTSPVDLEAAQEASGEGEEDSAPRQKDFFFYTHIALAIIVVVLVGAVIYKIATWGTRVDINDIVWDDSDYSDTMDVTFPLLTKPGPDYVRDDVTTIVVFGNAPFADDRDSEDNLASLIAKESGAVVYNCSISGSYMATHHYIYNEDGTHPRDAYCFYWLTCLATHRNNFHYYEEAQEALQEDAPPDAMEVANLLYTLDFNKVDVVAIMYDATDYLMGAPIITDNLTDIKTFTGNLQAGIEKLQEFYPHLRFIVMSPTYAYAVGSDGEYLDSDQYGFGGQDILSTYVIKESDVTYDMRVSFVDNYYGTITPANADEYLIDNLHINTKGRQLLAQRFTAALTAYDQ